jgi:hypothetical protein
MARKTIKELQADATAFATRLDEWTKRDTERREQLSKLLGSVQFREGYGSRSVEVILLSWEEIFWKLGELQADANYSCILEARDNWRNWAQEARGEAAMLRDVLKKNNIEPPEPPHHDGFGLGQSFPMRPRA